MKKCRPVVKGPSGGTLLFCFALPARGASGNECASDKRIDFASALPARGASGEVPLYYWERNLCLGAACTGCIGVYYDTAIPVNIFASALPARGAST